MTTTFFKAMRGDLASVTDRELEAWWDKINAELAFPTNLSIGLYNRDHTLGTRLLDIRAEGARRTKAARTEANDGD